MFSFLDGDATATAAIRAYPWQHTPLGTPDTWPAVLKTTVSLVLESRFPQCIVWGPSLITIPNDAFLPILGSKPSALGRPFSEVWSETWADLAPIIDRAFAGEPTFIEDFELVIDRAGYPERAFFTFCYSPIRDDTGRVVGMLDTVVETTGKVETQERQRVLSGELSHRLKNLLSVVQAVSRQTLRQASDLPSAGEALGQRLSAIGRAAEVLTASEWEEADLRDLVRIALTNLGGLRDRFTADGPPIRFRSQVALTFSLALHELLTNAIKYGAFSNDTGQVEMLWSVVDSDIADEARFLLRWQEQGGPAVHEPSRRGFGSTMIERSLRIQLRGDVDLVFDPAGLIFTIDTPLAGIRATSPVA